MDLAGAGHLTSRHELLLCPDGEVLQHGRTSEMIFDVPELVTRLSAVCELLPGDLIFTGTPAGVGNRRTPPRYLQPDETLVSRVEHIGEIRQRFA